MTHVSGIPTHLAFANHVQYAPHVYRSMISTQACPFTFNIKLDRKAGKIDIHKLHSHSKINNIQTTVYSVPCKDMIVQLPLTAVKDSNDLVLRPWL